MRKYFRFLLLALCFSMLPAMAAEEKKKPKSEMQAPETPKGEPDDFFDFEDGEISYKGAFVKMMLTLLGLILFIVLSVWILRRVAAGRTKQMNYGRAIKVLERRPLSAKSILYLVEIGVKKVVIAESQAEIRTVTTFSGELPEED